MNEILIIYALIVLNFVSGLRVWENAAGCWGQQLVPVLCIVTIIVAGVSQVA